MSQHSRGSSHHLLQWTRKERGVFVKSLTELINLSDVIVNEDDWWRPDGDKYPVEAETKDLPDDVLSKENKACISNWWLKNKRGANTPNWDFIGSASIKGKKGFVIIEAKAHKKEASFDGRILKDDAPLSRKENHEHIKKAIEEANNFLKTKHGGINISRDSHYQLANRIAYSWKFASLGIPVVLVYLGFLNDTGMQDVGEPFCDKNDWANFMNGYVKNVFPVELLEKEINCGLDSFRFLIRSKDIPINGVN